MLLQINRKYDDHHDSWYERHHHGLLQLFMGRAGTRVSIVGLARGEGALDQILAIRLNTSALSDSSVASTEAIGGPPRRTSSTGVATIEVFGCAV